MKVRLEMSAGEKIAWDYLATLSQEELDELSADIRAEADRFGAEWLPVVQAYAKAAADAENKIILDALNRE